MVKPKLKFRCSSFQDSTASVHASDPLPHPRYSHQPVDILGIRLQQVSICTQTDPLSEGPATLCHPFPWKKQGLELFTWPFPQLPGSWEGGRPSEP